MDKDFCILNKIVDDIPTSEKLGWISVENFKEFIKILKEEIRMYDLGEVLESEILEDIDKLTGDLE